MFTRLQVCRNKDGSTRYYLHLLNSKRVNGRTRQEFVCTLGRLDVLQTGGGLDRLIEGLALEVAPGDLRDRASLEKAVRWFRTNGYVE